MQKTKKGKGKKGGKRGKEEGGGRASWQLSGGEREREREEKEKKRKKERISAFFSLPPGQS